MAKPGPEKGVDLKDYYDEKAQSFDLERCKKAHPSLDLKSAVLSFPPGEKRRLLTFSYLAYTQENSAKVTTTAASPSTGNKSSGKLKRK